MTMTMKYYFINIIMNVIHIESWIAIQTNMAMLGDYKLYEANVIRSRECSHLLAIGDIRLIHLEKCHFFMKLYEPYREIHR